MILDKVSTGACRLASTQFTRHPRLIVASSRARENPVYHLLVGSNLLEAGISGICMRVAVQRFADNTSK
jgi:hypothetical protein